jgi:tRNA (cmo5U34)-methyltransferase
MSDNLSPYSAAEYDEGLRKTVPYYQNIYAETVDLVKHAQPGVRNWLDTGCGTGNLVKLAFQSFRGVRYLIADPSPQMIMQSRLNLGGIPQNQLLVVGAQGTESLDLTGFPCPQVITATLSHHYFDKAQRIQATQNCHDMLDEGGIYITVENILPRTGQGKEIALNRWLSYQVKQGKSEEEAQQHLQRYGSAFFPITLDEHLQILKEAGFRAAELFWLSHLQAGLYAIK